MQMLPSGEVIPPAQRHVRDVRSRRVTLGGSVTDGGGSNGGNVPRRRLRRTASVLDTLAGLLRSKEPEPSRLSVTAASGIEAGRHTASLPSRLRRPRALSDSSSRPDLAPTAESSFPSGSQVAGSGQRLSEPPASSNPLAQLYHQVNLRLPGAYATVCA